MSDGEGKKVLMFPGQGAQYVGMARSLYDGFDAVRDLVKRAGEVIDAPLSKIMFEGPAEELKLTKNTQPAIFLHSACILAALGEPPFGVGAACGHSLGEYSALYAAGSISFEEALWLVRERGLLMYESGVKRAGSMAAVIGLDPVSIEEICRKSSGDRVVCAANFNSPGQVVISGDMEAVRIAMQKAEEAGARRVLGLDVSGAFHSPLMEDASAGLRERLSKVGIRDARFPVISNATAGPVQTAEEIHQALVLQLTHPVRWEESMHALLGMGHRSFVEMGPGRVLTGLLKRIDRSVETFSVDTAEDLENLRGEAGA